jgi:hypothetical protein
MLVSIGINYQMLYAIHGYLILKLCLDTIPSSSSPPPTIPDESLTSSTNILRASPTDTRNGTLSQFNR